MTILIAGADGQLGRALMHMSHEWQLSAVGMDLPDFDITDPNGLTNHLTHAQPTVAVNAAAYTNVDRAEGESEAAFSINAAGAGNLATCCAKAGIPLIHISTDYVFDGSRSVPWKESDPISPLGVYGRSKAEGERLVREALDDHIIIRTAWMFGIHGNNFVKTMLRFADSKEPVRVVADQMGSPTCAEDLAAAICDIIRSVQNDGVRKWGTYHYCNRGVASWYSFAEAIFRCAQTATGRPSVQVEAITTDQYPTAARRPAYSVLDCSLIEKAFGITAPPWQESLEKTITILLGRPTA